MFGDRDCSLFLFVPAFGEGVLAVRQNWNECCIRKGVCLESVGALPFTGSKVRVYRH